MIKILMVFCHRIILAWRGFRYGRVVCRCTKKGLCFAIMKAIKARYDGKVVVPEEPVDLPANTPVRVLIPEAGDTEEVGKLFAKLSEPSFKGIWDNEEDAVYDQL